MCASALPADDHGRTDQLPDAASQPAKFQESPARLVRAEANLLRFPLFALHTKGLKSLDGLECSGRITRDGQTHQFTFRATRNTATLYPGPLARAAHIAFLSILTEEGLPAKQPLQWSWRDLCRRMGIAYSGRTGEHLKEAVLSTAGIVIFSEHALYSKPSGQRIKTQEEALHLYDRVSFVGSELPDGTTADANELWLSDWYRQNIDALYTAPLDYQLWRFLEGQSAIASRLYEFLLLNFYGPVPVLRINYETLTQFLPVHAEKYLSAAKRQMQAAFQLLTDLHIIAKAEWAVSHGSLAQLHLYRGSVLPTVQEGRHGLPPASPEQIPDVIALKELRNLRPAEWQLMAEFYRVWTGEHLHRPTGKELSQAQALVTEFGLTRARSLIQFAVKRMKIEWPDAKTFGALSAYLPDAKRDLEREQHRREREQEEVTQTKVEQAAEARKRQSREEAERRWQALSDAEKAEIRKAVLAKHPY